MSVSLIAPLSRGSVRLADSSMNTPPLIDPQWLADPTDMDLTIQAVKRQREIWAELVNLGVAESEEYFLGIDMSSEAQIRDCIQRSMTTIYQASATCKSGQQKDPMAVVDSNARVFGVEGLRVVDASSLPFLPPNHPQSTIYAFAERIADEILQGSEVIFKKAKLRTILFENPSIRG
ncbi:Glucose-methanol-choline oxidoreductase [Penicillium atrosanguineum]|nr:Glucose-methanol-choline oxidoreductase [Penicillium atrosanguineum]